MKKLLIPLLLACSPLLSAQETTTTSPVVAALSAPSIQYLTEARPAADAQFYIYLCSASWCPPCRAIMPKVVAMYPEIKAAGGEIILLCFDQTPEAGKAYAKKYDAGFPFVMSGFQSVGSLKLPGFSAPRGIPHATFVSADGKVLYSGHGVSTLNWKLVTTEKL